MEHANRTQSFERDPFKDNINETANLDDSTLISHEPSKQRNFRPNWTFLGLLIATLIVQNVHTGYVVAANYRMYIFLRVRFDWTEEEAKNYDSIFG